ncbi:MAG: DUF4445 domain-containing protein [Lachnospiraceae bacterium]|nr:DUF4445 domain-containing protein [Lachnospiraceae bacterium]
MIYRVSFPLENTYVNVREGTTVLDAEIAADLRPDAPCGGLGICGKCRVEIIAEDGTRKSVLACETKVTRDLTVYVDSDEDHRILTEGSGTVSELSPAVRSVPLTVEKATLDSPSSGWERLKKAVFKACGTELKPDPLMADGLEKTLDLLRYTPQAVLYHDELLALRECGRMLSAAVDIGTTTIVLYLLDQETGEVLATESMLNPQTEFGADVISRADYAVKHTPEALARAVRGAVNELLRKALDTAGAAKDDLFSVVIVGNTCMHHLFLGIDPRSLVLSPYVPSISEPLVLRASDYGLETHKNAKLFLLPCIAGFVGADTSAVMVSCSADQLDALTLMIDIGTNGELVLSDGSRFAACSTAAGPAFEGAKITFGMRGAEGAVDHADIKNGALTYSVIGSGKPRGICGSGLLDLTAALLRAGILDETGRFQDPDELPEESLPLAGRLQDIDGLRSFVIAEENETASGKRIYLSQKDIREVQLAKGAMAAGISLMLEHLGRKVTDIEKVLIAGAFGNYMSPKSACAIGLLPGVLLPRIEAVGNAAGTGAIMCAQSEPCFTRAREMASRTEFIELASNPAFQDRFVEELMFPEES